MVRQITLALLAITVLLSMGCNYQRDPELPTIAVIGDSHTMTVTDKGSAFPDKLREALSGKANVYNVGCSGSRSDHWSGWERWPGIFGCPESIHMLVDRVGPVLPVDILVVGLGANDAFMEVLGGKPEKYASNIKTLVQQAELLKVKKILLLVPPPQPRVVEKPEWAPAIKVLSRIQMTVPGICESEDNVVCGKNLNSVLRAEDYGDDLVHMKNSGHEKVFEALLPIVEDLLGNL